MDSQIGLLIEYERAGRNGHAMLTARLNGEAVEVSKVDMSQPAKRSKFIDSLHAKFPAIDKAAAEQELLRIADELNKAATATPASWPSVAEIDLTHVIRSELFYTPAVSGLSVPMMIDRGDTLVGQWMIYLHWADGRRERRQLSPCIELSNTKLWLHPLPSEPTASQRSGWSKGSRHEWLEGGAVPDAAEVFKRICERIAYFIDLPSERAAGTTSTLALWVLLTYCYPAWPAVPYLYVGGPLGSGKSKVFEILQRLVFRPFSSSNLTAAAIFRTLHNQGGSLLFDEAERLKQTQSPDVQDVLSMLLAGYKRGGQATRLEAMGDSFRTVSFDVYGPKALACIAGLPPALHSRCIPITMFRAAPGSEKPRRRIDADSEKWETLRDDLHTLALAHGSQWLQLAERTNVCPKMSGRDFELWQPLLALAAWLDELGVKGLLALMQKHAAETIDTAGDETVPDADETLLRLLAVAIRSAERPTAGELLGRAIEAEPTTFKHWQPRTVQARLKQYGIPKARKSGSRKEYRDVTPDVLRRIQDSYGIDLDLIAGE